jgi:hypothetical protein
MQNDEQGIDYFNRDHPLTSLQIKSSLKVRRAIYDWFAKTIGGVRGRRFLEHGSTPDTTRADSNVFARWLLEDGAEVYATSPEEIVHLEQVIPGLKTIPWTTNNTFPIKNLDYLVSSAVIEHVGSFESQVDYLTSLLEIAPGVLLTTPNRNHWLEFHTKLPFIHWLPKNYHRTLLSTLRMDFWSKEENLNLISKQELIDVINKAAARSGAELKVDWYQPTFMGMVSNLVVLLRKQSRHESQRDD